MKHKRLLTMLLVLCFVLSMMPTVAIAAEVKAPAKTAPGTAVMGQVSSRFESMPDLTDQLYTASTASTKEIVTADKFHATADAALAQLQAGMLARQTTIIIGVTDEIFSQDLVYLLPNTVYGHTGQPEAGDYLLCNWYGWGATIYQSNAGWTIVYEMTYLTTAEKEAQVDDAVDALLAELNLWNATDYEKIKGVYDWICTNVAYDYSVGSIDSYTAYGALINRASVGQGYAALFYRLMLELGVDCRVILGEVDGVMGHVWNIVKLDGVYYNVDVTLDTIYRQADVNHCYFLVSDLNFLDHVPDAAYNNPDFYAAYPKAEFNYDDSNDIAWYGYCGAEGENGENLIWYLYDGILVIVGEGAMAELIPMTDSEAPWMQYKNYITGVYVDEGVTTIGRHAFSNMTYLTDVYLSSTVKIIEGFAFQGSYNLRSVKLPDGLTTIQYDAFSDCGNLTEITIPDSVTYIGDSAFSYSGISEIVIPAGVEVLKSNCLMECWNLSTVILSEGLLTLGNGCMQGCDKLKSVTLPQSLERIEGTAFWYSGLTSIVIPENVNYIGHWVFMDTPIESIIFTGDAPEFHVDAFYDTTTTAYYPAGNETWTEEVLQQYGGTITWKAACEEHTLDSVITPHTCTENGYAVHTCTTCGLSYDEILPAAHTYTNDQDTICDVCTCVRHVDAEYPENPPVVHMFRLYDPNSGEHFYTGSTEERDYLVSVGWNYEGVGFSFPVVGAPVYRLYDPVYGEHMYTMDIDEVNSLILAGWNNEGIAFNTAPETEVPQYRLHNPNETRGAYHFTSSTEERDNLLAVGWEYQGIGWYSCWK